MALLVLKSSQRSLVKYFSTLEEKFRISARLCNILYLSFACEDIGVVMVTNRVNQKRRGCPSV